MLSNGLAPTGFDVWTIVDTIWYTIAILVGTLRLVYRWRRNQLHWDDFWAFCALTAAIAFMTLMMVFSLVNLGDISLTSKSFMLWSNLLFIQSPVWLSRISIVQSIVRILPTGRERTLTKVACCVIALCGITVPLQRLWVCPGEFAPHIPVCAFTHATAFLSLVLNATVDIFLTVWPIVIISKLRQRITNRWLLMACFVTSPFVLVIDCLCSVYFLKSNIFLALSLANLEITLALLSCNASVITGLIFRYCTVTSSQEVPKEDDVAVSNFLAANASKASSNGWIPKPRERHSGSHTPSLQLDVFAHSKFTELEFEVDHGQTQDLYGLSPISEKNSVLNELDTGPSLAKSDLN